MDFNLLIQRKRERFGDLEGQEGVEYAAGDPSRRAFQALYLQQKRQDASSTFSTREKLSGSTAAAWIRYKRGRLRYFRRPSLCAYSALLRGSIAGKP